MAIYVLTAHEFNHDPKLGKPPLDSRFLDSDRNYIFYLIDKKIPPALSVKSVILENQIDPLLAEAGKNYLGEWAFLLAEAKHSFCQYPFFMISSRFYQKNRWLRTNLNREWDRLFLLLEKYGWGYLPSYDRPLRWIDLEWKAKIQKQSWKHRFFPFTEETFRLVQELYSVRIPEEYRAFSDFFCNYIGFKSRSQLMDYVNFYRPLIQTVFDEHYHPRTDIDRYARKTGAFRNEKPFTFVLEWFSHLFFYQKNLPCFALHYDGYYEVDERKQKYTQLSHSPIPLKTQLRHFIEWQLQRMKTEGCLAPYLPHIRKARNFMNQLLPIKI
jgi:hypothetical protein